MSYIKHSTCHYSIRHAWVLLLCSRSLNQPENLCTPLYWE